MFINKKFMAVVALCATFIGAIAQQSQYEVYIAGQKFDYRLNDAEGTIEIYDANYKPEASWYSENKSRKLPDMDNSRGLLEIPPQIQLFGKTFTLTKIGDCAFADYTNIKSVIIPETVEEIGNYAFFRTRVSEIALPATVSRIGDMAFAFSDKLKKLSFPRNLERTGRDMVKDSKRVNITYIDYKKPERLTNRQLAGNYQDARHVTGLDIKSDVDENIPFNSTNKENTFVVIIANEKYDNVKNVEFALRDGRSFSSYCHRIIGIPAENIHLIENATLNHMINELSWLENIGRVYDGEATMIVYYAGHGIPDEHDGTSYLLPVDGIGSNIATGYSLKSLYQKLNAIPCKKTILFLDACFSGAERAGDMLASARGVAIKAKEEQPIGRTITFSAASGDETAHSLESEGHGLFTYFLLKKLKESNGKVSLGELSDYISKNVSKRSVVINNKPQTPVTTPGAGVVDEWRSIRF